MTTSMPLFIRRSLANQAGRLNSQQIDVALAQVLDNLTHSHFDDARMLIELIGAFLDPRQVSTLAVATRPLGRNGAYLRNALRQVTTHPLEY